jgi:hypothetical protein
MIEVKVFESKEKLRDFVNENKVKVISVSCPSKSIWALFYGERRFHKKQGGEK